jgi:hypothetical protein
MGAWHQDGLADSYVGRNVTLTLTFRCSLCEVGTELINITYTNFVNNQGWMCLLKLESQFNFDTAGCPGRLSSQLVTVEASDLRLHQNIKNDHITWMPYDQTTIWKYKIKRGKRGWRPKKDGTDSHRVAWLSTGIYIYPVYPFPHVSTV